MVNKNDKKFFDFSGITASLVVMVIGAAATFFITTTVAKATTEIEIKNIKDDIDIHKNDSKKLFDEVIKTLNNLEKKAAVNETDHSNIKDILVDIKKDIKDIRS